MNTAARAASRVENINHKFPKQTRKTFVFMYELKILQSHFEGNFLFPASCQIFHDQLKKRK